MKNLRRHPYPPTYWKHFVATLGGGTAYTSHSRFVYSHVIILKIFIPIKYTSALETLTKLLGFINLDETPWNQAWARFWLWFLVSGLLETGWGDRFQRQNQFLDKVLGVVQTHSLGAQAISLSPSNFSNSTDAHNAIIRVVPNILQVGSCHESFFS